MKQGRQTCRILKEIRRQIAAANDIEYIVSECRYKGDCTGTCPRCESELLYLERQLEKRRLTGKSVTLLGISVGFSALASLSACGSHSDKSPDKTDQESTEELLLRECAVMGDSALQNKDSDTLVVDTVRFPQQKDISGTPVLKEKSQINDVSASESENTWRKDTIIQEEILYGVTEQMPQYPGGEGKLMNFIQEQMQYPESCLKKKIQGRVVVRFEIDENGDIVDPEVLRSVHPELDKEALRIVSLMPRWIPGKQLGKAVSIYYTIPVVFKVKD